MWDNIETDLRILKQRCPNAPWLWERLEKKVWQKRQIRNPRLVELSLEDP